MSKIKNLIFDLDGVIIKFNSDDAIVYKEVLKKFKYNENDYLKIYKAIDDYEKSLTNEKNFFNRIEMRNFINNLLMENYSQELIDAIIISGSKWIKGVNISKEVLEELCGKYNLYIYSNYYYDCQSARIKAIGYDKYFKKILCGDEYGAKPFRKSFERMLNEIDAKPEECIMIGDNKFVDILGASNIGMKTILYDYDGKRDRKDIVIDNYEIIKNMKEDLLNCIYNIDKKL